MSYIIPVFISYAGCPHICAFCNQHKINRQEEFSLVAVQEQIDRYLSFLPTNKDKELAFYGGSFTGLTADLQEQLLLLAMNLKETGVIKQIRLSTRPDYIDAKVVARLLKYQVSLVELGVQSLDDNVLQIAKRGHDKKTVYLAVDLLKTSGIDFGIQLMLGLPEQCWLSVQRTTLEVVQLKPSVVRIYPLLVFEETDLAKMYVNGDFQTIDLQTAIEQAAYMMDVFERNNIKVIRLGLQEDEGLREQGSVLAGPYHPAFGELVSSYRCLQLLEEELSVFKESNSLEIYVPEKELSKFIGHKKSNVIYLKQKYPKLEISFIPCQENSVKIKVI